LGDSEPERALALVREGVALIEPGEHNLAWGIAGDLAARNGEQRDALAYFARAIDALHWQGNRIGVGTVLVRVADLLADHDPEATAVLQGAGETLAPGFKHAPHHVEAHERAITIVDATLGAECRHTLHAEGMAMNQPDAVNYANTAIARFLAEAAT
jgi:hypothetical protein